MNALVQAGARRLVKKAVSSIAPRLQHRRLGTPRTIAYLIAGGAGDGIMALPALVFLKKNLPNATIDVFVPGSQQPLLALLMRPFRVLPLTVTPPPLGKRYDVIFTNTIAAFRVAYELRARVLGRYSAGFRYPGETPKDRLHDFSLMLADDDHDIDLNLALVAETLGMAVEEEDRRYPALHGVVEKSHGAFPVVVHPGAGKGYGHKKWPFERYIEIIKRLEQRLCAVTVLLGPEEVHYYSFFATIKGCIIRHSHDPESLVQTLQSSRLFIGNDSGPGHCAALLGIPTITLFGPTSPARTAPRGDRCVAITSALPCAPCHFKRSPCRDNQCLKSISVDRVWKTIEEMLTAARR